MLITACEQIECPLLYQVGRVSLMVSICEMASLIAILDLKGKPLIQRSYRDDVPASYVERFLPLVLDIEEEGQQITPCFSSQGINYMHIRHSNLYRMARCYVLSRSSR